MWLVEVLSLFELVSVALPLALILAETCAADIAPAAWRPGALAGIASDGGVTREDDTWLRRILLDDDGTDMRALARSVVHEAGERYGYKDDMTVLAIRLEERK